MKNNKVILIFLYTVGVFSIVFGIYFFYLLNQVQTAFNVTQDYLPTQIYSSVTRISAPMPRAYIERKLKGLGYVLKTQQNQLIFTLHSPTYPDYLLPAQHPTRSLMDQPIRLTFESQSDSAPLQSIVSVQGKDEIEVNEFYLEPEFLAPLTPNREASTGSDGSNPEPKKDQIREFLKLAEFPKNVPDAVMAAEDQHFYSHFGIDPRGFVRALWYNLKTLSLSQGGSTITQQLVKNLMERRNRNIILKVSELFLAPVLEFKYTKDQILERYLNEVFLGQIGTFEVRGFSEGAKYFFGKKVTDLNTAEIALLVGIIKGPAFYSPYKHFSRAQNRKHYVLERMLDTQKISLAEFNHALQQPIRIAQAPTAANRAPYFVDYVKAELTRLLADHFSASEIPELGLQVYTTLDLDLNQIAQETLQQGLSELEKNLGLNTNKTESTPVLQSALVSLDHSTGSIRALIGGRNYADSSFNRILNMKRQAGSTFKPIVYATAFSQISDQSGNTYTSAYPLNDQAWSWKYDASKPEWKPSNYERKHLGWISLRTSLTHSINTTAARLAKNVGLENIIETAKTLGITSKLQAVPSLSLGGSEVSPIELLNVYSTFANHGMSGIPLVILGIIQSDGSEFAQYQYDPKPKIDPGIADLMTHLLQGVFDDGTAARARSLGFNRPAAGKTGTTNDYRDSWFAGYTPELTTVVWVGLDQGVMKNIKLTGASGALPLWTRFMSKALKYTPEIPFPESEHLVELRLDSKSGQKAQSSCPESQVVFEKVIVGREPKNDTCLTDDPVQK
jgi:penicillin-binding protein 1B